MLTQLTQPHRRQTGRPSADELALARSILRRMAESGDGIDASFSAERGGITVAVALGDMALPLLQAVERMGDERARANERAACGGELR